MSTVIEPPRFNPEAAAPQRHVGNTVRASWQFSTDDIRRNTAEYGPDVQKVLLDAFLWCIDDMHPMAKPDFAARVGSSDNTIYKIYTGKYVYPDGGPKAGQKIHPSDELMDNIQQFLEEERARYDIQNKDFVMTQTAKTIIRACDLAKESHSVVFLNGPSHVGKTWTLEHHYTPLNNHGRTIYVRMESASGVGGMVRIIAHALGISPNGNTQDLRLRIKGALTKDTLLIIDEAHLLSDTYQAKSAVKALDVLREFHDRKKCPMLLSFTHLDEIQSARQSKLQQLWRRGVHKFNLPVMPTKADLGAIFQHNGFKGEPVKLNGKQVGVFPARDLKVTIESRDDSNRLVKIEECPYEVIRQVAREEALLAVTERIRYAKKLSKNAGKPVDWYWFTRAHLIIRKESEQEGEWS